MRLAAIVFAIVFALGLAEPASAQSSAPQKQRTVKRTAAPAKAVPKRKTAAPAKRVVTPAAAAALASAGASAETSNPGVLDLKSSAALVLDAVDGTPLFAKNADNIQAIASITKLMTAIVVLDADQPLDEMIRVDTGDIDRVKGTGSRLRIGAELSRREMLHLALMSSENRAASALGRHYPGGMPAFVERMNQKAAELGMHRSRFVDPTGLSSENVSTADDLARLVQASLDYPLIREFSTSPGTEVRLSDTGRVMGFGNSNGLVRSPEWQISVSKTGYISEAGRCLVMHARIAARPVIIVLLDSWGLYTRIGDANRIKRWMEHGATTLGQAVRGGPG